MNLHRATVAVLCAAMLAVHGAASAQDGERGRDAKKGAAGDQDQNVRGRGRGDAKRQRRADAVHRRDEMVAQFTRADRDSDNRLGRNEWTPSLGSFDLADANHDGVVTRAEFLAANRRATATIPETGPTVPPAGRADPRRATAAFRAGFDRGATDGRQAGREDRQINGGNWDLEGQRELEQADAGYQQGVGARADYQAGYREGFRRAYREGFGPR